MFDMLKRHRERVPFVGEMLSSILVFPCAFTFLDNWIKNPKPPETSFWLCAMCLALGLVHLFRGFRLRGQSRSTFVFRMVYAAAMAAAGIAAAVMGYCAETSMVVSMTYWACTLAERVRSIARNHRSWNIILNVVLILLIALAVAISIYLDASNYVFVTASISADNVSLFIMTFTASIVTLISIMANIFSQIRVDILKDIIRKTYAGEIIFGLLVTMVAFSFVLAFFDPAFTSFWQALWYCFAIVTTIGFGDVTATDALGRCLSVILGIYGIVVVALITSIIVNFYGEIKKVNSETDAGDRTAHA